MTSHKRQELINKLSMIGYYEKEENKNSIFLSIAAVYHMSEDKYLILQNHVEEVLKKNATWDKEIIYKIT